MDTQCHLSQRAKPTIGSRRISFPNLFADLLRLLPAGQAQPLEALYKDPQASVDDKLQPLWPALAHMFQSPLLLLLDNIEDLIDPARRAAPSNITSRPWSLPARLTTNMARG